MQRNKERQFKLKPLNLALRRIGIGTLVVSAFTSTFPAQASTNLPSGGTVTAGTATINNTDANHQTITQTSNKAVINWNTFSIGSVATVNFIQPASSSVILNRVTGGSSSSILGTLSANGQVFLVNPQGIYFGANASVDVAGLVATTLNISDTDFLNGNYIFNRDPSAPLSAEIVNQGRITVGAGRLRSADGRSCQQYRHHPGAAWHRSHGGRQSACAGFRWRPPDQLQHQRKDTKRHGRRLQRRFDSGRWRPRLLDGHRRAQRRRRCREQYRPDTGARHRRARRCDLSYRRGRRRYRCGHVGRQRSQWRQRRCQFRYRYHAGVRDRHRDGQQRKPAARSRFLASRSD